MPLFPFFPMIVWLGLVKVVLDATHDLDERTAAQRVPDPDYLVANSENIITLPAAA